MYTFEREHLEFGFIEDKLEMSIRPPSEESHKS